MQVISGGQTGADRAGLEAARAYGLPTGGTAPANFWTEHGPDPSLSEFGLSASGSLKDRTKRNVLDADATIVFMLMATPGSVMTLRLCAAHDRPVLAVNPWDREAIPRVVDFLRTHRPRTLNIAGNRESKAPGVHDRVLSVLIAAFREYLAGPDAA